MKLTTIGKRLSTRDFVYFELKKRIIDGSLEPSQPVHEEELATKMEISRTPIREALQRLELENLVIRQTNGRLKIAPMTVEDVEELYNVRSLLEGLVVREATTAVTEKDIQQLKQLTKLLFQAAEYKNGEDVVYYGSEIHYLLYKISGNKTAVMILNQLNDHIARYRRLAPSESKERSIQAAQEHNNILDAIIEGNPDKAEMLMVQHINNSLKAAIETIKSKL